MTAYGSVLMDDLSALSCDPNDDIGSEATPLLLSDDAANIQSILLLPGMKIRSHAINSKGRLVECPAKTALTAGRAGAGFFWIDIDADDRDAEHLRDWLGQLKLSRFIIARLSEPSHTWASQVIPFKTTALAMIRILPVQTKEGSPTHHDDMAHLAALSVQNLLVTFNSCPRSETGDARYYANVLSYLQARERIPNASSSGALLAWLMFHIEQTSRATRDLRFAILKMDEAMDRDVESVDMHEVVQAKEQLLLLLSVAEEQVECLDALAGAEKDTEALDFSDLGGTLNVLLATASATERMAVRLEKHIIDLRQRQESFQQLHINRRLATLTVISAMFLPLMLMSGIWGMNFDDMPELQRPWAYPAALACMATVAATMMLCFWRGGWLD